MRKLAMALLSVVTASSLTALPARGEDVVRVGALKAVHYTSLWYLPRVGAQYGVKFEIVEFTKGVNAMEALKKGAIDMAASGSDAPIAARAAGVPLYIVAGFSRGGLMIVGRSDLAWKGIGDLKGKRVGVCRGGAQELALMMELGKHGLTCSDRPGQDVLLVYTPSYPTLNDALEKRSVDAMSQIEPQAAIAVAKGFGKEILKPYDTELGWPVKTISMTEKLYNDRRGVATRALTAFVDATRLFLEKPEIAKKFCIETVFGGQLTPEEYDTAIANAPYSVDVTVEHVQATIDAMVKHGLGRIARPPVARDFVKLDLLVAANRAAGMR